MLSKVHTISLWGLESNLITVETDLNNGLPALNMVGLPDITVRESKERIRGAIVNSGFGFPQKRITVNLAPANTKKAGAHFDLPLAIGVLAAEGVISRHDLTEFAFIGELSLDGNLNGVNGVLPLVLGAAATGIKRIFVPEWNKEEGSLVSQIEILPARNLVQVVDHLNGIRLIPPHIKEEKKSFTLPEGQENFSDVVGQDQAKRALTISAAGCHNILLSGPPGCGKTLLARRLPTILPSMSEEEILEVTKIYSIAGELTKNNPIINLRPFRGPHHTISAMAMAGGGTSLKPGEISLAHKGVLFLDEIPEFNPYVVELLRQPLEEDEIRINRVRGAVTFPAKFLLVAACNPCKCGYLGDPRKACSCTGAQLSHYKSRLSGPILDRIDLNLELMPVDYKDILADAGGGLKPLSSEEMAESVVKARKIQARRYEKTTVDYNSQLKGKELQRFCHLSEEGRNLMQRAFEKMSLTMRSHDKILKVARTIADLEGEEGIGVEHLAEALRYRRTEDRREASHGTES